jgi:hypothetical protein
MQFRQSMELFTPFKLSSGNLNFMLYALAQATLFTNLYAGLLLSALVYGGPSKPWNNFDGMINLVKSGDYKFVIDRLSYENNW